MSGVDHCYIYSPRKAKNFLQIWTTDGKLSGEVGRVLPGMLNKKKKAVKYKSYQLAPDP
jgi:hypothetical protein